MHSYSHPMRNQQSLTTTLPIELVALTLEFLDGGSLSTCALLSSDMRNEAERVLYRDISLPFTSCTHTMELCCNSILASPRRARACKFFSVVPYCSCSKNACLDILRNTLKHLVNLRSLYFDIDGPNAMTLIGHPFALTTFSTEATFDSALADFLLSQPSITQVDLVYPPIHPHQLTPAHLPSLRVIQGSASAVKALVPGRPVENVNVLGMMTSEEFDDVLVSLSLSSEPIRSLAISLNSCDLALVNKIADQLPNLEALRIAEEPEEVQKLSGDLQAAIYNEFIEQFPKIFARYKCINVLVWENGALSGTRSKDAEQRILQLWKTKCPSLNIVVMPSGNIWDWEGSRQGRWTCRWAPDENEDSETVATASIVSR